MRKRPEVLLTKQDMTPMIDCIFQLIVFFVLINDFSNLEIVADISIPNADKVDMKKGDRNKVTVNVVEQGKVQIEGVNYDEQGLIAKFKRIASMNPSSDPNRPDLSDVLVYIRADKDVEYQHVQKVMYLCQDAGLWKISFAATKER